jgi:hypothetical protein
VIRLIVQLPASPIAGLRDNRLRILDQETMDGDSMDEADPRRSIAKGKPGAIRPSVAKLSTRRIEMQ